MEYINEHFPGHLDGLSADDIMQLLDDICNGSEEPDDETRLSDDDDDGDDLDGVFLEGLGEDEHAGEHDMNDFQQQEDAARGDDTPGTAAYYIKRKSWRLSATSPLTVLQQCYILATEKMAFKLKDTYIDRHCRYMSHMLGPGNLHPRSWYLVQKVGRWPVVNLQGLL